MTVFACMLLTFGCGAPPEEEMSEPKREEAPTNGAPVEEKEASAGEVPTPRFGEVIGIEAIIGRDGEKRATRDKAAVNAVVDALKGGTWTTGHMPRCMHDLYLRLVPPSAEGGHVALMCTPSGAVHLALDGETLVLDTTASAAVRAAALPLATAADPLFPPTAVVENLGTITFDAGVWGEGGPAARIDMHSAERERPVLAGPNRGEAGPSQALSAEEQRALVDALHRAGFFARASVLHSQAVKIPASGPRPGSTEAMKEPKNPGWMVLTVLDGEWYRTYWDDTASAVLAHNLQSIASADELEAVHASVQALKDVAAPE